MAHAKTGPPSAPTSAPTPPLLSESLEAWAAFPVTVTPRPLVLTPPLGGRVNDPVAGFTTDNLKQAYEQGFINAPTHLPGGPHTAGGFPIITAAQALHVLKTNSCCGPTMPVPPLEISSITLGSTTFLTDRGRLVVPAWLFVFRDVANPAAVLAVAPPALYLHPASNFQANGAILAQSAQASSAQHTLTVDFVGAAAGPGPCTAEYGLQIATSPQAIAVEVKQVPPPGGTPNMACIAVGYPRQATAFLPNAIGRRVVVDAATRNALTVDMRP